MTENTGGLPPTPPLSRASACGVGSEEDSSREREKENDGGAGRHGSDSVSAGMSDEVSPAFGLYVSGCSSSNS